MVVARMELDAERHRPTGSMRHFYGSRLEPERRVALPVSVALVIVRYAEEDEGAFYLLYLDAEGNELTNTFHETVEAAQRQAEFEFRVGLGEWVFSAR